MTVLTEADLYVRGAETLLASWEAYARGSAGATVRRLHGVAAAVVPGEPERGVYNTRRTLTGVRTGTAAMSSGARGGLDVQYP